MRSSDRLLVGILVGIGVLLIAGVAALFVAQGRQPTQFPEDTPEGVVQRYLIALDEHNMERAYSYLASSVKDDRLKQDYYRTRSPMNDRSHRIVLDKSEIAGETAHIIVTVFTIYSSGAPGGSEQSIQLDFRLKREDAQWRITTPSYPPYLGLVPMHPASTVAG